MKNHKNKTSVFSSSNLWILLFSVLVFSNCEKFVDVGAPKNGLSSIVVFTTNQTATAALFAIYAQMQSTLNISRNAAFSADEYQLLSGQYTKYTNTQTSSDNGGEWSYYYKTIYMVNALIDGLNASSGIEEDIKNQLIAEAKVARALSYFYLVNFFGDVPYTIASDYRLNQSIARTPKADVYNNMIQDLKEAQLTISSDYLDALGKTTVERVRPTKLAISALLARIYLYTKDWENAEIESSKIIDSKSFTLNPDLNAVFLKNSTEAIWQLQPASSFYPNGPEGDAYVLRSGQPTSAMSDYLYNAFSDGDKRKTAWIGTYTFGGEDYHYAFKHKKYLSTDPTTEYIMVLRLAEQYLIRSEARAQLNNIAGAVEDINVIRDRARNTINDLPDISNSISKEDCLDAILKERQRELFFEWGNRWFDLIRMNRADEVLGPIKAPNWQTTDQLYAIPQTEIDRNPAMVGHQNPGYN